MMNKKILRRNNKKVCNSCGANNDDAAVKCSICGEVFATNGFVTRDEATTLIEPMDAGLNDNSQMNANMQPKFTLQNMKMDEQPQFSQSALAYAQPQATNKNKLFIILGAIALVAIVAVALVLLLGGKDGANSPEEAAKVYLEGIEDGDVDKMMSVAAPFASKEDKETLDAILGMMSGVDINIKYIGLNDEEALDVEELQDEIKDSYGKSVKLDDAMGAELEYEMTMSLFGQTTSETTTEYLTFIKYKGKWYIYF